MKEAEKLRRKRVRPAFGKIQLTAIDDMAQRGVAMFDMAVLLNLIGLAKYNGIVYASQREIAEYSGTYQANVSRAIKRLKGYGYLHDAGEAIRIDPFVCAFGGPLR